MKKIMFSDRYGLTRLVLAGKKTQTRRTISVPRTFKGKTVGGFQVCTNDQGEQYTYLTDEEDFIIEGSRLVPTWEVGDVVAIAQRYGDIIDMTNAQDIPRRGTDKGWENKMYVKAGLMPYKIIITNVWIEKIQNISDEDCMKEGIRFNPDNGKYFYIDHEKDCIFNASWAKASYSNLITKISGEAAWLDNPLVWVYEFKLADGLPNLK